MSYPHADETNRYQQKAKMLGFSVTCPYCGDPAIIIDSCRLFRKSYGAVWVCTRCSARVGCHRETEVAPLGTLANASTRDARERLHAVFDPLWVRKAAATGRKPKECREAAYRWLAHLLDLEPDKCHIAMFDLNQCRYATAKLSRYFAERAKVRRLAQSPPEVSARELPRERDDD